jgi:hypothetical protein
MADPKNKWNQPSTPPPPMFFGKKERDLVKQVNDELSERIIGQPIAYYPISLEESNFNEVYGEAIEKVSLPPVRVYAYVEVENEQSNEVYGYEYQTKLTVNFSKRRITEDQNLYVRVGDFVQYGDYFYEIVRTYNDTRYYFGQVEHKFQISAECVRAREGAFRVMPAVDRPAAVSRDTTEATAPAPRPAPYPPLAASYVTINPETKLPNERVITAGSGITFTDTGAGGTLTITSTGAGDGIFTTINGSQAYVTSSLAIGGTTAPDHKISVSGSVSASVNISASAFYGDGSKLSNITTSPAGATTQLQYNSAGSFAGSANLTFNGTTLTGSFTGSSGKFKVLSSSATHIVAPTGSKAGPGSYLALDVNNNIVLSAGDGSTTSPAGANTQVQFNNGGAFGASANLTFNGTTLTATGLSSTGNTTLGDASGDSVTINAATINPANIAAGTDNTVVVYNGSTLVTDEIDPRVWGATLVDATGTPADNQVGIWTDANTMEGSSKLTFDGTALSSSTAQLTHLTASHLTVGLLSSSANVSASAFYGTGSSLTDLTIGKAEDTSYADGLFTDFSTTTPVGTAVDRFNEILKALAPGPAPNLDDIDCDDSGASSKLSFGSSQAISGYTNVGTAAGFSAVDINGTYSTSTSGNNLRRATFDGTVVINGDLNEDVSADGVNYPANSFGDANTGDLWLQVNGTTLCTASMTDPDVGAGVPGSGTGTDLNGNGSGFYSLSQTGSAEFADGTELDLFQHRTGKYKVAAADQRAGWNYLRVVHTSSAFSRTTNYVEWVNDLNTDAITASLSALDTLSMTGDMRLSGVKYHRGGTAQYRTDVGNAYRNVYTSTNISYTVTNGSISSVAMPSISVGSQNEMKILQLTGSLTVDATSILNGSIGASVNVAHPIKSNLSNGGSKTISGILAYNRANNSTTTSETFRRENYRIVSGNLASYSAQANVTDSGNAWNSTSSLVSNDGLLFYNQRLYSPIDGDIPNNGNFSTIANGPGSNVNYSSISGTRTFFRYFTNTGAASQTNFRLTFAGDTGTRIVDAGTSLAAAKIHVFVKLPNTTTAMTTGWLDLGSATANDAAQLNDFDGCYVGTPPGAGLEINNDTHEGTLVTQTVEQNENIVVKIVADAAWTGYISSLSIAWGSS